MNKTNSSGFSFCETPGSYASLQGRVNELDCSMREISEQVQAQRRDLKLIRQLKEEIDVLLNAKTADLQKTLTNEILHLEDELKREIHYQKSENSRIQTQLTGLKGEKLALADNLSFIQSRIVQLEVQVGNQEHN